MIWDSSRLARLRKIVAEIYPREEAQRVLVTDAGLRAPAVKFDEAADVSWFNILHHASEQQKVDALVDVILRENPENELLRSVAEGDPEAGDSAPEAEAGGPLFEGPEKVRADSVKHFVGRDGALAELRARLADATGETAGVVVTGVDGIGKTALVRHFVAIDAPSLFPAGVAWLDGTDLPNELVRVAERFGWRPTREQKPEQAFRWLVSTLQNLRVLLVIDDPPLADLLRIPLPRGLCRTLVTSRFTTLHAHLRATMSQLSLSPWAPADGRSYLRSAAQAELSGVGDGELDELTTAVGALPLAMCLVGCMLVRPGATVAGVLVRLRTRPIEALDAVAIGVERGIAETFRAALQDLGEEPRRVLRALSVCARATRAEVVAQVAGLDDGAASDALQEIAARSLAVFTRPDARSPDLFTKLTSRPWSLPEVLRLLVRDQDPAHVAAEEAAHLAFATAHAEKNRDPTKWREMEEDAPELLAAMTRLLDARDGAGVARLLSLAEGYMTQRGRHGELVELAKRTIPLLPRGATLAWVDGMLGDALRVLGKTTESIGYEERALELYAELGDRAGQATTLKDIGARYKMLIGDQAKAIGYFERSLALAQDLGDARLALDDLRNLGDCRWVLRDIAGALDHYEQMLGVLAGLRDARGKLFDAPVHSFYAYLLTRDALLASHSIRSEGLRGRAASLLGQLRAFAEGLQDQEALGNVLTYVARCQEVLGPQSEACACNERVVAIGVALGDLEMQAGALSSLSRCYLALGDWGKARERSERALELSAQFGGIEIQAISNANLGLYHQDTNEAAKAIPYYERALELLRQVGKSDTNPDILRLTSLLAEARK